MCWVLIIATTIQITPSLASENLFKLSLKAFDISLVNFIVLLLSDDSVTEQEVPGSFCNFLPQNGILIFLPEALVPLSEK